MVAIPNLRDLLETLGVDYKSMTKTSKTTSEMEVELNLNYDFSAITEEGAKLIPVNCAGVTGLKNLGNSCYMNSVLQMVACVNEVGEKVRMEMYEAINFLTQTNLSRRLLRSPPVRELCRRLDPCCVA